MVGVDVVDVARFRAVLMRSPGLEGRLFSEQELCYCNSTFDPPLHLAGTFAAKEAVVKALSLRSLLSHARRIEITRSDRGAPHVTIDSSRRCGSVSISHDAGVAIAVAIFQAAPVAAVAEADLGPWLERAGLEP
jgi:holo-[acyl-carrier protein] synthase